MSKGNPGEIWVGTVRDGGMVPVPKACPMCGRKVIRTGNRHHREVFCEGYILHPAPTPYGFARDCDFRATVYRAGLELPKDNS